MKTVPAVVYYPETDEDRLTVKRRAMKDNGSFGAWDYDALANEWDDLPLQDWGVPAWDTEKETPPATATEDDFNEDTDNVETRCKRGDVWVLGEHRLMCGDSTDADCLAKLMNGHKADMVFTDPPYGVEYQSNARKEKFDKIKNDDTMLDFLPVLKPYVRGFVFVCASWKNVDEWIVYFKAHYPFTNMVVWNKGGGGLGDLKHSFATDYELILVSNNGQELKGKRIGSVWNAGRDNGNDYLHPTQKPVTLSATAIENTTDAGGIVADLFGGSGSTLIACEQLGRKCYTMELDEHYCDVILARWEKLTGKTAERVEN
jgi:DNA modification methylase